eukprot:TRINITY_DN26612_c0_g1_i1.p2 TRINITY_DN26612_c0_g1~~TRINITY_DN26612_c0_g1_i1.p2  ORF type:complete len:132 (+),score=18.41 TRINITY_DN26612_c0_g1_i1:63-458(+)
MCIRDRYQRRVHGLCCLLQMAKSVMKSRGANSSVDRNISSSRSQSHSALARKSIMASSGEPILDNLESKRQAADTSLSSCRKSLFRLKHSETFRKKLLTNIKKETIRKNIKTIESRLMKTKPALQAQISLE